MMTETILLVDDDQLILQMCRHILEAAGYKAVCLEDGRSLLETVASIEPSLILLDIMLPETDGLTLCRQLRGGPKPFRGPIIIFSAKHYGADKRVASEVGANAYLEKPFSPARLLNLVRDLLAHKISVRFWGVRGSIPTPSKDTVAYGGNTPCIEVRVSGAEDIFIWDGGTGLRELGRSLRDAGEATRGFLCFTHFHWDHIQGLPFFGPAYVAGNAFTLVGPGHPTADLPRILSGQMASAYFPVSLDQFGAALSFREIGAGAFALGGVRFDALSSLHPGSALIYRISHGDKRVIYATDNELPLDWKAKGGAAAHEVERFLRFFEGADLLIHDAQYTPQELERRRGWGHSSWSDALDIAVSAGVKNVQFFHHDPDHSDNLLDEIRDSAQRRIAESGAAIICGVAREGDLLVV